MALYPAPVTYPSTTTYTGEQAPVSNLDQPYAVAGDVTELIGVRVPAGTSVDAHITRAHALVVQQLSALYPNGVPTFTGLALQIVADAESELAAASIMTRVLAQVEGADWTAVNGWREDAKAVLSVPLPGYDPSATDPDYAGPLAPVVPAPGVVSSRGPYVGRLPVATGWPTLAPTDDLYDPWP